MVIKNIAPLFLFFRGQNNQKNQDSKIEKMKFQKRISCYTDFEIFVIAGGGGTGNM